MSKTRAYTNFLNAKVEELSRELTALKQQINTDMGFWLSELGADRLGMMLVPLVECIPSRDDMKSPEDLDTYSTEVYGVFARHYLRWLEAFGVANPDITAYIGRKIVQVEAVVSACDQLAGYEKALKLHLSYEARFGAFLK